MHLIKFLTIGGILAISLGELGKFPFGSSTVAISVLDLTILFLTTMFFIWKVISKEKVYVPFSLKWIVLFWIVGIISLFFSLNLLPLSEVLKGGMYLIRFILYSLVFLVGFNIAKAKILPVETVHNYFIGMIVVLAILGIAQLYIYPNFVDPPFYLADFGFDPHRGRLTSTFLDPNFFGAFMSIGLGLVLLKVISTGKKIWWLVFGLIISCIILTLSRSAYLLSASSLLIFFLLTRKQFFKFKSSVISILILTSVVIVFILSPVLSERISGAVRVDKSSKERIESWKKGLVIAQINPLIGVGFNNLRPITEKINLLKTYSVEGGHSGAGIDSSLLLVLATTGIVGLVIYLTFWLKILRALLIQGSLVSFMMFSLIIGLFINSQFINSLFFPAIMFSYFLLIGSTVEN